jgi:CRP-like cAMP-binding protein
MSSRSDRRAEPANAGALASPFPPQNQILSKLPAGELATVVSHAEIISVPLRQRMFEQDDPIEAVYFPLTGMISLVIVLKNGRSIESRTVGREGFVGSPLLHDVSTARYRGICQIEGNFLVLNSRVFLSIIADLPDLKRRLLRYSQFASEAVAQSAACNSVHSVEQRCARWLLITADATGANEFHLTQEFLAQMLAVRRPGVTIALGSLVKRALVSKRYGQIRLVDVEGLKSASCECYETIRAKAGELLS